MIDINIDINKLKDNVVKKRDEIVAAIRRLKRDDPFKNTDRALIVEPATDASQLFGHEQVVVLGGRLAAELKEIERALEKIKKKTYGMCEKCRQKIDLARLNAKPAAIYCVKCAKEVEKGSF